MDWQHPAPQSGAGMVTPRPTGSETDPPAGDDLARSGPTRVTPVQRSGSQTDFPSRPSSPIVSVVIPVLDDRAGLEKCLEALGRQDYPKERMEVIVVDNGSRDKPARLKARFPGVRFVEQLGPGSYGARNHGIRLARGEVLAFTDADCVPDRSWVANGVRRLGEMSRIGFLAGSVAVTAREPARPSLAERYEIVLGFPQAGYVRLAHFGATCNLFTTAEIFRQVGLFDDRLYSAGDIEWCRRVFASGREPAYAAEVEVVHRARASVAELIQRARRVAAGVLLMERPYPGRVLRDQLLLLLPRPTRVWRIMTSPHGNGPWTRLQLLGLHLVLRQVKFWERVRVLLGGEPRR